MKRNEIINTIGQKYLTSNIENDEFSYKQALKRPFKDDEKHFKLDLRFESIQDNLSIIIETKNNDKIEFTELEKNQLIAYAKLEREYKARNKIISILYNTKNKNIMVWKDEELLNDQVKINSIQYYIDLYSEKINDKEAVLETTNKLNELLHSFHVLENQRSQFVGCLLVALNNNLEYSSKISTKEILSRIKTILEEKIDNDENKKLKTELLIKTLDKQNIKELKNTDLIKLLDILKEKLIPFINNRTPQGEDLLNLFFTTFNKYVGKADKNQAFTPMHITDFMCEIAELNKKSRVLDPTCGSGSFLVQAMAKMLFKADGDEEAMKNIKKNQLFGIEREDKAFGLATTNMLIHEDGKTNVICASCFEKRSWIKEKNINVVLMNPPFNGQKMPEDCPVNKKQMDVTKGFYFVKYIADVVNQGMLATILPLQCAIGTDARIADYKRMMLENHTLEAVFSLPNDVFHPGTSTNVCVLLFKLGVPHDRDKNTFFGYYKEDGFVKKKNKGRVEKINWEKTKKRWLDAFWNKKEIPGFSVVKKISFKDEWLAEAYMETDYSVLTEDDFVQTIRNFVAFKIKNGEINE